MEESGIVLTRGIFAQLVEIVRVALEDAELLPFDERESRFRNKKRLVVEEFGSAKLFLGGFRKKLVK